jgi:hypothetical protein
MGQGLLSGTTVQLPFFPDRRIRRFSKPPQKKKKKGDSQKKKNDRRIRKAYLKKIKIKRGSQSVAN